MVASHFFEKAILKENLILFLFLNIILILSLSFFFFFLLKKFFKHKQFLDTRLTHDIYKFGVNPAFGSTQSWRVDRLQIPESLWYLSVQ